MMEGYRIIFTGIGQAALESFAVHEPQDGEVLIEMLYSVLSAGTERANLLAMPNTPASISRLHGYCAIGGSRLAAVPSRTWSRATG
jgi:hypothetical protein